METHAVERIQQVLDYEFKDICHLQEAFLHSSVADDRLRSNERMEFLGDSVLSLVICKALYLRFPHYQEGDLTKIKSRLVSRKTCSQVANEIGLPSYIQVGKGMDRTRAMTGSIAAASLESVIGAIFLDGGMDAAERFILRIYDPLIAQADAQEHQENFKSLLQQYCQQEFSCTPLYDLLDEKGPDHNKCFEVAVVIRHRRFPSAWGITKKEAEQKAAYNAGVELGIIKDTSQDMSA